MATPAIRITARPSPGVLNQRVTDNAHRMPAARTNPVTAARSRRLTVPRAQMYHNTPLTKEITAMVAGGMWGSRRKLLKPMAAYSFRRTATQNTGREKKRNAMKVTP